MSRARDMANLGAQAGSGLDASDITTGTLGNTVQDNITRLGTVTSGTFNGTMGASATGDGIITLGETFRLNNSTGQGTAHTLTDWTVTSNFGSSSMAVDTSNGEFTAPSQGFYIISVNAMVYNESDSTPRYIELHHKFGGSSFFRVTGNISDNGVGHYTTLTSYFVYDWTNTSTKLIISFDSETNVAVNGHSSLLFTSITFTRIGDT